MISFAGQNDGEYPTRASSSTRWGKLYGTTFYGGSASNGGTVFQLKPPSTQGGAWTETVLHRFTGLNDGLDPEAGLVLDRRGALYGSILDGTVFKLTPPVADGANWTFRTLYRFTGANDGPQLGYGSLIFCHNNALFGTAKFGGGWANAGTVFQLTPGSGAWTETTLHPFQNVCDGAYPYGGLVAASSGSLLGATSAGGVDGSGPAATLVFGKGGALYGTTPGSGAFGKGTVFQIFA